MIYLSDLEITTNLSVTALQYLTNKFEQLCTYYELEQSLTNSYQKVLFEQHQEQVRHYHNLSHLYNLNILLERFQGHFQQLELVQLAIWYHDSIYDITSQKNEFLSAQLALNHWQEYLSNSQKKQLEAYILATSNHQPKTFDQDELLFLDLDLSILAATPTIYKRYSQAIEREYTSVYPLQMYRIGRQQVLKAFLERPQIYYSIPFIEQYEATARINLTTELEYLQ